MSINAIISHQQEQWEPLAKTKIGDVDLTNSTSTQDFNLTSAGVPTAAKKVRIYVVITIPSDPGTKSEDLVELTLFTRFKFKEYKQYIAAHPAQYYAWACNSENMVFPVWEQDMSLTVEHVGPTLKGEPTAAVYVTGYCK